MKRNPTFFVECEVYRYPVVVAVYEKRWVTLYVFCVRRRTEIGLDLDAGLLLVLPAQPNLQELLIAGFTSRVFLILDVSFGKVLTNLAVGG